MSQYFFSRRCNDLDEIYTYYPKRSLVLFIIVSVIALAHRFLTQSKILFSSQIYAEAATNYYVSSISDSWREKLFYTDYGYVPLLQRIIGALADVLGIHAFYVPYLHSWSATILGILLVTFFVASIS